MRDPEVALRHAATSLVHVELPAHLQTLACVNGLLHLEVVGQVTQRTVLNALEQRYPALRGTIRDHRTQERRAIESVTELPFKQA